MLSSSPSAKTVCHGLHVQPVSKDAVIGFFHESEFFHETVTATRKSSRSLSG